MNSTKSTSDGDITYNDLASLVNTEDVYSFLDGMIYIYLGICVHLRYTESDRRILK